MPWRALCHRSCFVLYYGALIRSYAIHETHQNPGPCKMPSSAILAIALANMIDHLLTQVCTVAKSTAGAILPA
ncbi:hypothetical protein HK26_08850 [Acetobacter okinawensis]|uniref:Uncharacterized protein n=1 Tax=Acetobacter okinawensis TaxID=1076594 RepID=A0A252BRL4_9PROT|nr:hypothetical protein HK26_08850 [Acetobacter okinawensis]